MTMTETSKPRTTIPRNDNVGVNTHVGKAEGRKAVGRGHMLCSWTMVNRRKNLVCPPNFDVYGAVFRWDMIQNTARLGSEWNNVSVRELYR